MKRLNEPFFIIFEDDARLPDGECVQKLFEEIHNFADSQVEWDILMLGAHSVRTEHDGSDQNIPNLKLVDQDGHKVPTCSDQPRPTPHIVPATSRMYGLYGYIVNTKNIEKLIRLLKPFSEQIDSELSHLLRAKKIIVHSVNPLYVYAPRSEAGDSDVQNLKELALKEKEQNKKKMMGD